MDVLEGHFVALSVLTLEAATPDSDALSSSHRSSEAQSDPHPVYVCQLDPLEPMLAFCCRISSKTLRRNL